MDNNFDQAFELKSILDVKKTQKRPQRGERTADGRTRARDEGEEAANDCFGFERRENSKQYNARSVAFRTVAIFDTLVMQILRYLKV